MPGINKPTPVFIHVGLLISGWNEFPGSHLLKLERAIGRKMYKKIFNRLHRQLGQILPSLAEYF